MKNILFLVLSTFVCSAINSCNNKKNLKPISAIKPNIILIMADDLGVEALGTYNGSSYKTPNLDKLALDGMQFNHCYSTPLCTPSRIQIMTGKYNYRNYIGFGLLDPNEKTFAHYLKELDYKTFIAGKWQLLGNAHQQKLAGNKKGTTPEKAGFDEFCLWQIDHLGSRYKSPTLSTNQGTKIFEGDFGPDIFVDKIETFIDKNKNTPFFIYYPMVLTHDPFVPTPDNSEFKTFDPTSKVNDTTYFGEMVQYTDKLIGRIRSKVEELGVENNTLILFVGDNGTDRDITSIRKGKEINGLKGYTTNAGTHVPLIAYWNGKIKKGSINNNLIDFTDFLPTFVQATNENLVHELETDGVSFYPQLLGNHSKPREWIFTHYEPNWGNFTPRRYVQNKKWKLYANGEFYDLEKDDKEQNSLDVTLLQPSARTVHSQFNKVLLKHQK